MTQPTRFDRLGLFIGDLVVRRRRLVTALSLLLVLGGALGLLRARFSTDYRLFFSKEDPGLAAFERLEHAFTKTDNVLFVVHAKDGDVFATDPLAALQDLTEEGWKLPHASRVDSLTNFQEASAVGDDIRVASLVERAAGDLTAAQRSHVRDVAHDEPILRGSLVSKDDRTAAVNVTIRLPGSDPAEVAKVAAAARGAVARAMAKYPQLDIRASGMVFVNDAFMQASVVDMGTMIPLMVGVMILGIWLIVRSKIVTAALTLCIAASAALSMAVAGWLGYPLTPTSVAAPIIVLTVAIADGVHIALAMMADLRAGRDRASAARHAIAHHFEAVTYTWLTTIVGFLCLNYSDAPPVQHLANMTSVGVTVAYILSVTLLPALLVILPVVAPPKEGKAMFYIPRWLPDFVIRRRHAILAVTAVVTVATGVMAAQLRTNDQFIQYFGKSLPFRRDADFVLQHLSGLYRVELLLDAGDATVADPSYLQNVDRLATWLRTQPEVDHVYSLPDIVRRVHQVAHGGGREAYALPETRAIGSEDLLLYEMNLPAGLDLTDRVSIDKRASRLSITIKDLSTTRLNAFVGRTEEWIGKNAPHMATHATGPVVIFSQMSERNARNMVRADFLSLGVILLCMVLLLRSFGLGVVSVILNVVPVIVGYGVWWLVVGEMNIVATIAASISLGIIVDDTIHFLTKFRTLSREPGMTPEAAIRKTLEESGPAMLSTGAILCLGFGVLTLSSFQMSSHLGWLSLLIIAIAPLTDLFVTPALVLWKAPARDRYRASGLTTGVTTVMKHGVWLVSLFLASTAGAKTAAELVGSGSPEQKGQAVVEELGRRNAGFHDFGADVEMELADPAGSTARRDFNVKVLEHANAEDGDRSLIVFSSPADVKGTAVLSHAQPKGDDEQWLYLPASRRTKRVSSSNRGGAFVGSEFSFEDLTAADPRKFGWRYVDTEACGSARCLVLEATPKDAGSAYSKRVLFIDDAELRVQRVDFYDRKSQKLKTLTYDEYRVLGGKYARAGRWTMKNAQSNKSTTLRFSSMKLGAGLSSADFTPEKLER